MGKCQVVKLFVGLSRFNCIHEVERSRFTENIKDLKKLKPYKKLLEDYNFNGENGFSLEINQEIEELAEDEQVIYLGENLVYFAMDDNYLNKLLEDITLETRSLFFQLLNDYVTLNIDKNNKEFEEKYHIPAGPVLKKQGLVGRKACN